MRVLWICNIVLPEIAPLLSLNPSNKEGWLSGLVDAVKKKKDFELAVAFPVGADRDGFYENVDGIDYYGFYENTTCPECYDSELENRIKKIADRVNPDVIHIFGTEFPHTRAACTSLGDKASHILVGIQGILTTNKEHYADGVPEYVIRRRTFRDRLRKDSIPEQIAKYEKRSANELVAVKQCGNITGRTDFDYKFSKETNEKAVYYHMNETLRKEFYSGCWTYDSCTKHTVFLSQGNYPVKGVHYVFEAVNKLREKYTDISVRIAGDVITNYDTLKQKIKISTYGKYLRELIDKYGIRDNVVFLGNLSADKVKEELLNANVFVCPSTIENSPNSLGEAMLLSVPCVTSDVGGITSIFNGESDGIVYKAGDIEGLVLAIDKMFSDVSFATKSGMNAHEHAAVTHSPELNYKRLLEIYSAIGDC